MEGREDTGWLHHDFTPGGSGASSSGKLIRGVGGWGGGGMFAAQISSNVRPRTLGEAQLGPAIPREGRDFGGTGPGN